MIITICKECNAMVRTLPVENSIEKDKNFKAFCKCSDVLGRSEKRALRSFKKFNETQEIDYVQIS